MAKARILFVDDEVIFADNMSKLLKTRGYRVSTVYGGEEAIRQLEKDEFDIIVLDLKMPGMDGLTTLKEIKKLGYFNETLILTGHGAIDSALEATRLGAYDYLTKPCEIDELVDKLDGAFDKKDEDIRRDMDETVKRCVESPASVFDMVDRQGRKRRLS